MPAQFKPSYEAYTDSYCWIANTYCKKKNRIHFGMNLFLVLDIPIDQELPDDEPARRNQDIVKYLNLKY